MKQSINKLLSSLLLIGATVAPSISDACTSFTLKGQDGGSYVYARTVEFGRNLQEAVLFIPRNHQFKGTGPDGVAGSGLNWTNKYAIIGLNIFNQEIIIDGMNEKGLSGGLLNFPNTADYQNPTGADAKNSIAGYQMLMWALSNYDSVDDVKAGLQKIYVNGAGLKVWGGAPKIHMTLHDMQGKSIVVEYIGGKLVVTDNPIGTMTNEPPMQWQLTNIGNYANLTPVEKPPLKVDGQTFLPPSSGTGLHGLPGDFLSSSRFVRAFLYSTAASKYAPNQPQVELAWHLINMFDIPPGTVEIPAGDAYAGGVSGFEYTQDSVVADPRNQTYYVRNFASVNIKKISFKDMDLNASKEKTFALSQTNNFEVIK